MAVLATRWEGTSSPGASHAPITRTSAPRRRPLRLPSNELAALGAGLDAAYPRRKAAGPAQRDWLAKPFNADDNDGVLRSFGLAFVALVALVLSLGAITLLLAMAGLYGVQSHIVAHRTREIGVRLSVGATAAQVRRMVLKDGYAPVLQGLALGLFFGVVGRALVRSFLVARVDVIDPWMLLLVPIPLLLAAFCACYLPARRASRVDPNVALRHL